ncbi:DUF5829 family protein [Aequorivita echinoideorum]|uniref:Lipoprotein n=1 Tax=Aequorivita echinoideorum TaxID=1549647 RepID=A0ABS5S2D5_9FLAO|nr:DUF5829 family protein [Aequorivita echinoideorum]MBT0607367.1 hypothetical protein [Aequorivita echinoideorum]
MNWDFLAKTSIVLLCLGCTEPVQKQKDALIDKSAINKSFSRTENQVSFSHLYVVLDSISYNMMLHNDYLKSTYAGMDSGLPGFSPIDSTAKSIYLRGRNSYLEILGPQNSFAEPVGQNGIGFALEAENGFSLQNKPHLKETDTKFLTESDTVTFLVNNKNIIWYKPFYTVGMETNIYTWYSYRNPEFLSALYNKNIEKYTEEAYLQGGYKPQKLFENVTQVEIECSRADHYRISKELQLLGCKLKLKSQDTLNFAVGNIDVTLVRNQTITKSYISRIDGTLNAMDNRTLDFHNLKIENSGRSTRWHFKQQLKSK